MPVITSIADYRTDCLMSLCESETEVEKCAANVSLCDALLDLGVPVQVKGIVDEETYQLYEKCNQKSIKRGETPPFDLKFLRSYRFVTSSYEVANGVKLQGSGIGRRYTGFLGLWQESGLAVQLSLFRDVPYADGERVVRLFCEREGDEKYRQVLSTKVIERDVPFFNKYTKIVQHGLPLKKIEGFFRENGSSTAVVNELVELVERERRYLPEGVTVDSYVGS